ncbi:MAG: hypothetical protein ACRDT6_17585 [Micromonosporaceae bacterium]
MHPGRPAGLAAAPQARHPADADPVRASKARAVVALGIVALGTSVTVGGLIPAVLALWLARQSREEMRAAGGFLTGHRLLRTGERLAWTAILISVAVLVYAAIVGIMRLAPGAG